MSLFSKLNQVKDLRSKAKNLQNQLSEESVTVEKHNVSLSMDGNQQITKLDINPELLSTDNKERLEKILIDLHGDAIKKVQRIMAEKFKASGNFNNLLGSS